LELKEIQVGNDQYTEEDHWIHNVIKFITNGGMGNDCGHKGDGKAKVGEFLYFRWYGWY
jgi:hypothetical protein